MRVILHSDLNNFFASVEVHDDPSLAAFPVAVCGSVEERAGIVLAKNELARSFGVRTAETVWQATQKCPHLKIVPPRFHRYVEESRAVRAIYARYTDVIEPFGIDEAWLDVTGSLRLFGNGETIANRIREDVKRERKLTVSVGISFNKVFAKLGSDLHKPDGTTLLMPEHFRTVIWPLSVRELIGIGGATEKKLSRYAITTIGKLAQTSPEFLRSLLGVSGISLWRAANGLDNSPVIPMEAREEVKSIGNSATTVRDLRDNGEVWRALLSLSAEVSRRLREKRLNAGSVVLSVKDNTLAYHEHQAPLDVLTRSSLGLARVAMNLFKRHYSWNRDVRAVGIRAIRLVHDEECGQLSLFSDTDRQLRTETLETTVNHLEARFGEGSVRPACLLTSAHLSASHAQPFGRHML